MDAVYRWVDTAQTVDHDGDGGESNPTPEENWATATARLQGIITAEDPTDQGSVTAARNAETDLETLFDTYQCDPVAEADRRGNFDMDAANCEQAFFSAAVPEGDDGSPAVAAIPLMETTTDPSFFQATIGYVFGDTSVGVSWYRASDTVNEGSELTAVGVGVNHNLPKIATNVYAAAQDYSVEDGAYESDDTVIMIGARIKF